MNTTSARKTDSSPAESAGGIGRRSTAEHIDVRAPLPDELVEIEKLWVRTFDAPATIKVDGDRFVQIGRHADHGIAPHVWHAAHRLYVQHRLKHDLVLVASIDGGLAGFVAFSLPDGDRQVLTIHYIYVLRPGRRNGIGRLLFELVRQYAADVPIRTTHTNNYWQRFFEAVRDA